MEKIYWNAKEGQIMTKGGECLYDKRTNDRYKPAEEWRNECNEVIASTNVKAKEHLEQVRTMQHQLQCSAKGHGKWVYQGNEIYGTPYHLPCPIPGGMRYTFKCDICGLEITKTESELTASEKSALSRLGVRK